MKGSVHPGFGLVIAFVCPGFIGLIGVSYFSTEVAGWLERLEAATSVGEFLLVALGSTALGLFVSGVRWAVVEKLIEITGVKRPDLDEGQLVHEHVQRAFALAVENFYRYYQFYANTLVAGALTYVLWHLDRGESMTHPSRLVPAVTISFLLFMSSRNSLERYYKVADRMLSAPSPVHADFVGPTDDSNKGVTDDERLGERSQEAVQEEARRQAKSKEDRDDRG